MNIEPKGTPKVTDETLVAVGESLNSKSVTKLNLIIGSFQEITGDGLAKLTALNTNAQETLEVLSIEIEIKPVNDDNANMISGNIAKFKSLHSFAFNGKYFMREAFTSAGIKSIFNGISLLPNLSHLSVYFARVHLINSNDMDIIGETISSMKGKLKFFDLELSDSQLTDKVLEGTMDGINNLNMLTNLQLTLNDNNLSDDTFTKSFLAIKNNANIAMDFHFENNNISTDGITKVVSIINASNFDKKLSLGLQNQGPSDVMDEKLYTEPFACLKKHSILDGDISIKETKKDYDCFVEVTDYYANFDEKVCPSGIKLTTHVVGGPTDAYSDECLSCE